MNIVLVNDFAHVNGGVAQVVLASARELARRGHAVVLLAAVDGAGPDIGGIRVVSTHQQEIATDPSRLRAATQGLWNLKAQRAMRALLASLGPQNTIVHLHGWTKALSSSVIHEALRRDFPLVTTLHDYFSACPNGGFFNYQTLTPCSLRPLSGACIATHCDSRSYPQKLWRVARQFVQQGAAGYPRNARHFITVSRFSADILKHHLPAGCTIHAVRNPVTATRGEPVAVASNSAFTYLGRLSPEKGAVLMARAAAAANLPATFVGDGPLREQVASACPAARMAGWLRSEQALTELRRARALVLPSLWYETQGLVVSEAAAMGVPAIVPDGCAARDWVVNGVTGLWFKSGDQDDLQRKMAQLHGDPALAAQMGAAAFERFWSDPPTLAQHANELETVYREVASNYIAQPQHA